MQGELSLRQGIVEVGGDPSRLPALKRSDIKAFLELHIEQGPVLETGRLDIGVVTAISGITRIEIIVEGQADHAGTTPMDHRRDALVAASRLVLAIEALATEFSKGEGHFTATVGEFSIEPNAANVVPSRARLLIDARAELQPQMEKFIVELGALAARVAGEAGVTIAPAECYLRQSSHTRRSAAAFDAGGKLRPESVPATGAWPPEPGMTPRGWGASPARR